MSTAPAPNAAAPPGMCPGVAVLGGGGGAGGGDGGGDGGGGGNGGGGDGNGNGGNGDGKGAGECGPGSGGGCPNPAHGRGGGTHAGDPIDPLTGRVYTIPETDMPLVGPLVFAWQRAYSSFAADRDIGLGYGWSHSLAWTIRERRGSLEIAPPFGTPVRCDVPAEGAVLSVRGVGLLRRVAHGFVMTEEQSGLFFHFEAGGTGGVAGGGAPASGATAGGTYRVAAVVDTAGNAIVLEHGPTGHLVGLTDSAGRRVTVRRDATGHIERFELLTSKGRTVAYRRYEYNDAGQLVTAVDAEGRQIRHVYDRKNRLVERCFATGKIVHFRYDRQGRCVESWVDYGPSPDPALAGDVPAVLADGVTPPKGMLHIVVEYGEKSSIVYDSRQSKRFDRGAQGLIDLAAGPWVEALAYDAGGRVAAYSDPTGQVTRYERDGVGRLLAVTDPAGHKSAYRYDPEGRLIEAVDELGAALRYAYDPTGNLKETWDTLGTLLRCAHDARGLRTWVEMPNGAVTRWEHDGEGNLVTLIEPHGKPRRFEVDDVGRILAFTDEEGHRTAFAYDTTNALRSVVLPNGATSRVELDPEGRVAAYQTPDGAVWRLAWAGHNCVHALEKPTGETLQFRYDREGNLVRVVNERGEEHTIERDAGGRVVRDRFFDGREYRYKLDAAGRLIAHENGAGERTRIERDACGRVIARTYDDGSEERFEHDPVGRLVGSDTGSVRCRWEHDARGNLARETQTHESRSATIEHAYNAAGQRVATRTSTGVAVTYERDLMGNVVRVSLPGGGAIERTWDALGREVARALPGGAHIVCTYDGIGTMTERRVVGPAGVGGVGGEGSAGEPAWAGRLPRGTTFAEGWVCSPGGELVEHVTSDGERERFTYDAAGRVLARTAAAGEERERYAYEGTGRLVEPEGLKRDYGPGGTLLSRGDRRYAYDAEGRRVAAEEAEATLYCWNGRGMLAAVVLPDGTRIEHTYDTQGRRVLKRVWSPDRTVMETRFIWSGDDLIQETTWRLVPGESPSPLRATTYIHDDNGSPLAHRETVWTESGPVEGGWVHYALGPGDLPELLIGGDGAILARLRATIWGRVEVDPGARARTPWRFPGQYFDEEVGLCYNRYRFYDPEVGLYINADPLGVQGGLGAYDYARGTPLWVTDPEGLEGVRCVVMGGGVKGHGSSATARPEKNYGPEHTHPIVRDALPQPTTHGQQQLWPQGKRKPTTCAEPQALSDYIRKWEERHNNGKQLNPEDPNDHGKIQRCLQDVNLVTAKQESGKVRAPCSNCTQLLVNLNDKWGGPRSNAITPGASGASTNDRVRGTPPADKRWKDAHSKGRVK